MSKKKTVTSLIRMSRGLAFVCCLGTSGFTAEDLNLSCMAENGITKLYFGWSA